MMAAAETSDTLNELAWRGIEHCRKDDWKRGFYWLSLVAEQTVTASSPLDPPKGTPDAVPSLFFAYLGYGLARLQGEHGAGLRLCRQAVDLEPYQPENFCCLARTLLLAGERRSALEVIGQGLQIDATHDELRALRRDLGERRPQVMAFLPRRHFLNRTLGRLRHRLFGPVR